MTLDAFTVEALDRYSALSVQREVLARLPAFWGARDVALLHHPMWFRQFSLDGCAARTDGALVGYLLGVLTPDFGYVHLVATRLDERRQGVGAALYGAFLHAAANAGVHRVEAITTPGNTGSVAFHRRLGFTDELIDDYAGPGEARVLLRRTTAPG